MLLMAVVKAGLSTGRYLLQQELEKKGVPLKVEELREMRMSHLEKSKQVRISELLLAGEGFTPS